MEYELKDQWWNPEYAGEGFFFTLNDKGRLIGAYFTHLAGAPTWFTFDCPIDPVGDFHGNLLRTTGGQMGEPRDPESVLTEAVGRIEFYKVSAPSESGRDYYWRFRASNGNDAWGYRLYKLFPNPEAIEPPAEDPPVEDPPADDPPVEDPPVEDPPEPTAVVEHKLGNEWQPLDVPVLGTIQGISASQIRRKKLVREYRITAPGALNLVHNCSNKDPAFDLNPSIQVNGNNVKLYVGPSTASFPGLTKHAGFRVDDATHGTLIDVGVQVGD